MTFDKDDLARISTSGNEIPPTWRSFVSTTDALATVIASGYFNEKINDWEVDDVIHIQATDGYGLYKVNSVTTNVTVEAYDIPEGNLDLADGKIFVGDATNKAAAVDISGDATITNAGVLTIENDAVTTAKILDSNVTLAKLAAGITPSHVVKFAGQPTTVGGAATEAFTVTGALATDLAFVQVVENGTNSVNVLEAVVTTDTLTLLFTADPTSDCVFNYQLLRAAT